MRWFLGVLVLLAVTVMGVYGAGSALSEKHTIIRGAYYAQPIEQVWDAIANYEALPKWNSQTSTVERLPDQNGKPVWKTTDVDGNYMVLVIENDVAPNLHVSRIVETNLPFGGAWMFELKADEDKGTYVKLTEKGEIPNPLFRFFSYYFLGLDYGMRAFLRSLGEKFDETPTIQELVA